MLSHAPHALRHVESTGSPEVYALHGSNKPLSVVRPHPLMSVREIKEIDLPQSSGLSACSTLLRGRLLGAISDYYTRASGPWGDHPEVFDLQVFKQEKASTGEPGIDERETAFPHPWKDIAMEEARQLADRFSRLFGDGPIDRESIALRQDAFVFDVDVVEDFPEVI